MFSRTSLASWDFFTITSLSFTAVCILRTLDWFLWVTARVGTGWAQLASSPTPGPRGNRAQWPPALEQSRLGCSTKLGCSKLCQAQHW